MSKDMMRKPQAYCIKIFSGQRLAKTLDCGELILIKAARLASVLIKSLLMSEVPGADLALGDRLSLPCRRSIYGGTSPTPEVGEPKMNEQCLYQLLHRLLAVIGRRWNVRLRIRQERAAGSVDIGVGDI